MYPTKSQRIRATLGARYSRFISAALIAFDLYSSKDNFINDVSLTIGD
jgi:hypothetical protein